LGALALAARRYLAAQEAGHRDLLVLEPELLTLCRQDSDWGVRASALKSSEDLCAAVNVRAELNGWLQHKGTSSPHKFGSKLSSKYDSANLRQWRRGCLK
jgi:hypothetical protein